MNNYHVFITLVTHFEIPLQFSYRSKVHDTDWFRAKFSIIKANSYTMSISITIRCWDTEFVVVSSTSCFNCESTDSCANREVHLTYTHGKTIPTIQKWKCWKQCEKGNDSAESCTLLDEFCGDRCDVFAIATEVPENYVSCKFMSSSATRRYALQRQLNVHWIRKNLLVENSTQMQKNGWYFRQLSLAKSWGMKFGCAE